MADDTVDAYINLYRAVVAQAIVDAVYQRRWDKSAYAFLAYAGVVLPISCATVGHRAASRRMYQILHGPIFPLNDRTRR